MTREQLLIYEFKNRYKRLYDTLGDNDDFLEKHGTEEEYIQKRLETWKANDLADENEELTEEELAYLDKVDKQMFKSAADHWQESDAKIDLTAFGDVSQSK